MRKRTLLVLLAMVCATAGVMAEADFMNYGPAYGAGDIAIQGGLSLGLGGLYGDAVIPPVSVSLDWAKPISDLPLSFGALVGYASSKYEAFTWSWKYTYIIIGGRAAWHVNLGVEKLDTYFGTILGYNIVSVKEEGVGFLGSAGGSYFLWGGYVGGRYFFTPNLAAYGELGYGVGILSLGVTYKL